MDLLEETEGDRRKAASIEFGSSGDADTEAMLLKVKSRGIFTSEGKLLPKKSDTTVPRSSSSNGRSEASRKSLQKELSQNTRALVDPFLSGKPISNPPTILGIKRKRTQAEIGSPGPNLISINEQEHSQRDRTAALVGYGDDSD